MTVYISGAHLGVADWAEQSWGASKQVEWGYFPDNMVNIEQNWAATKKTCDRIRLISRDLEQKVYTA